MNEKSINKQAISFQNYWVSLIVLNEKTGCPYLLALTDSISNLEKAKEVITKLKKQYKTVSAWVDIFDDNNTKTTVLHECYLDTFGLLK